MLVLDLECNCDWAAKPGLPPFLASVGDFPLKDYRKQDYLLINYNCSQFENTCIGFVNSV